MHELGIANSVLDAARAEAQLRPSMRLTKIVVRVGDLAGIDPDALSFCFEALVKETDLEPVVLEIERRAQRHRCPRCGNEFVVINYDTTCRACGETMTTFLCGNELELAYLEMEDL
ncbi:MAG TPA: hydrogenase maturation nickel metallochaperone HypA [Terriglobales bacterium]|nr:hydrogenase maturation nickel metallochaperone HypA [Terriglobales bacterium]